MNRALVHGDWYENALLYPIEEKENDNTRNSNIFWQILYISAFYYDYVVCFSDVQGPAFIELSVDK